MATTKRPSGDDRETPPRAIEDIINVLKILFQSQSPTIYDPYYCKGTIKNIFQSFGYPNVINQDLDFYKTIKNQEIPQHDILITNPPYSQDHIRRALTFTTASQPSIPFAMLLPSNVCSSRDWYASLFTTETAAPLFLCPHQKYSYVVPNSTRTTTAPEEHTPYVTMWYIGNLTLEQRTLLISQWKQYYSNVQVTLASCTDELPRRVRKISRYADKKMSKKSKKGIKRKNDSIDSNGNEKDRLKKKKKKKKKKKE